MEITMRGCLRCSLADEGGGFLISLFSPAGCTASIKHLTQRTGVTVKEGLLVSEVNWLVIPPFGFYHLIYTIVFFKLGYYKLTERHNAGIERLPAGLPLIHLARFL